MKTRTSFVLWWLPVLFYTFLIVNTQRTKHKKQSQWVTDAACELKQRPTFHHAKSISGDAHVVEVECDDTSIYVGERPTATCRDGVWHTHGGCRQYLWHNPPKKTAFFLPLPLTTVSRRSFCLWLTPIDSTMFQVTIESEDRMSAIVIIVFFEMVIRDNPHPPRQGIRVYTRDTRDPVHHRKMGIGKSVSAFIVNNRHQIKLTAASITTLVISVDSKKLLTYDAATRIDLLTSVHVHGLVVVNDVDGLCHTCDVKESPTYPDVEITWQNGSWPLVGSATCKEKGFTWKGPSASHSMCFADLWSLNGVCEEEPIKNPTRGKVYSLRKAPFVGYELSIKGIPSANTSFSLALTKGNDIPVAFIFQFSSQRIIGKSKFTEGYNKKTFYRVFPLIVGQPFVIIMTITDLDEVAVQVDSLKEPLHFKSTMELVGPEGVQGFSARGDVIITELNLRK